MAARELEDQGRDVIRLDIGDPDFELPSHYADSTIAAIRAGHTHYSPMAGIPELRRAVATHMQRRFGLTVAPDHIVANQGATQGLNAAITLVCDRGDTILLPELYWPNYVQQAVIAGVRPAFYRLGRSFQPLLTDLQELADEASLAGSRIAAVLVNSPGNPTGALFTARAINELYSFAQQQGAWLISDEAYCDYVFAGDYVSLLGLDLGLPEAARRVLAVFSGSKSYASTGMRMGWTVTPTQASTARLALLNEPLTGSLTTPIQHGLAAALEVEDAAERRESLVGRWNYVATVLEQNGIECVKPGGGLFYFLDISSTGLTGEEFAARLLAEHNVAVVPGDGFGLQPLAGEFKPTSFAQHHVRLCFAVPEQRLRTGLAMLIELMTALTRQTQPAANH